MLTCKARPRLEDRLNTTQLSAWNARTRSSTGGGATAMARWGAAGRRPRSPPPATESPTARRPGHSSASQAPAAARLEARRGGKANLLTGLAARRAFGAMHDGAARGVPQPFLQKFPWTQLWRKHWDDAAWGSHDPRLPLAQRDAAAPMGRRRRGASNTSGSKARAQAG
jgi:hypothetical protein